MIAAAREMAPVVVAVLAAMALAVLAAAAARRGRALARLHDDEPAVSIAITPTERGWLARRLALAGRRTPGAAARFVSLTLLLLTVGGLVAAALIASGTIAAAAESLRTLPGAAGEIAAVVIEASPLIIALGLALIPWLVVRAERRTRVRAIEQDLPLALELLATLGEAGFGFDAAVSRLLDAQTQRRPLTDELRFTQAELRAGVPRVRAMRNLAARSAVPSVTILVSAVVQAEQVGAGIAGVLRRQADDLRSRRREDALVRAQALPVKLVFPLVICFLPGLFVVTLGPAFHQFAQLADSALKNVGR